MIFLKKTKFSILIILALGAFLRFYGLNWGLPYPFHPDERNMADAITRFSSTNLDPKFYAYGQFPLYLAYFSGRIFFSVDQPTFTQAILALRFWSTLFSIGTIFIVYLIGKKIIQPFNLFAICYLLFAVSFAPGLIQSAHFGTTESILAFCFLTLVYLSLKILEEPSLKNYLWSVFFLGIALGSKITSSIFITPLILATLWQLKNQDGIKEKLKLVLKFIFFISLALSFTLVFSPYLVLAYRESRGTLLYEISVARGKSQVFYTRQFINTIPILFQFQKIFPYALGWPVFILGILGFLISLKSLNIKLLILSFSFLTYFLPQAFLFCKWTRFMTPIFPFFPIFAAYFLNYLGKLRSLKTLILVLSIVPGLVFSSIYFRPDIRFTASEWIYKNIPSGSHVLSETANVVDIPITPPNYKIPITNYHLFSVSFNFYDLDQNSEIFEKLLDELVKSDYIFVPSRRLFANHLRLPQKYPLTAKYYQLLFSEKLGFEKIAEINPFPKLSIFNFQFSIDDEQSEETFTVFDHPVIRIYKRVTPLTRNQYEKLFKSN